MTVAQPALSNAAIGQQRRRAIMTFIKGYIRANGYSPSHEEIAVAVGLTSKNAVRRHLDRLIEDGLLESTPGTYRSLRLPSRSRYRIG